MPRRKNETPAQIMAVIENGTDRHEERVAVSLCEMAARLISFRTPASSELAADIYKAIRRAWHKNRRGIYGEENTSDPRERDTVRCHVELLDSLRRAEGEAETPAEGAGGGTRRIARALETAPAEDEWPEVIGEGGAR